MDYEQMEIDITLESDRDLKENMQATAKFALGQIMEYQHPTKVKNRHEGYGIAAEGYASLQGKMKSTKTDMDDLLKLLPNGDGDVLNVIGSLYNSAVEVAVESIKLAAQAQRIMDDLYYGESGKPTPMEEYMDEQEAGASEDDGFEEADNNKEDVEEMDGLGSIPFERAKIPSGGGLAFELPGETEDEPVMSTELTGVILHHHPVNAYWAEQYSGGNEQPDCSSYDGKQGVERETGEIHDCSKCPHNQFGSAGAGKACKNIHRCYILQESNPVPIILALPPTSLKYIRDYIGKRILLKGLRCYEAVTKITLKKEKSADGITYSRAAFTFVSKLTDEQKAEAKAMAENVKAMAGNIPEVDEADYNTGAAVDAADFQSVDGDANLPFN